MQDVLGQGRLQLRPQGTGLKLGRRKSKTKQNKTSTKKQQKQWYKRSTVFVSRLTVGSVQPRSLFQASYSIRVGLGGSASLAQREYGPRKWSRGQMVTLGHPE